MSIDYGKKSHAGAWQRLTADDRPLVPVKNPLAQAQQRAKDAYQDYYQVLRDWFMGKMGVTSSAVGIARVKWCVAESRLVDLRAGERKAMEFDAGRWKGFRSL